jgi:hypothetical protein
MLRLLLAPLLRILLATSCLISILPIVGGNPESGADSQAQRASRLEPDRRDGPRAGVDFRFTFPCAALVRACDARTQCARCAAPRKGWAGGGAALCSSPGSPPREQSSEICAIYSFCRIPPERYRVSSDFVVQCKSLLLFFFEYAITGISDRNGYQRTHWYLDKLQFTS